LPDAQHPKGNINRGIYFRLLVLRADVGVGQSNALDSDSRTVRASDDRCRWRQLVSSQSIRQMARRTGLGLGRRLDMDSSGASRTLPARVETRLYCYVRHRV